MNGKRAFYRSQLSIFKPFVEKCSLSTVRRAQDGVGKLMAGSYKDQVSVEHILVGDMRCVMLSPTGRKSFPPCRYAA